MIRWDWVERQAIRILLGFLLGYVYMLDRAVSELYDHQNVLLEAVEGILKLMHKFYI